MRNTRQRREQILHSLVQHGNVQVSELATRFRVSTVTIRGDLDRIAAQGLATRSHGGAHLVRMPPRERDIHEKTALNPTPKDRIGAQAARMVSPGDNILIDSGSTTLTLARHLRGQRDITVMTNGLNIAWELASAPGVKLLLTGGQLHPASLSLHGGIAETGLHNYSFDTLFLGVDGLDPQFGLTTHNEAEAHLNRRMVERARRVVVLADASKFGVVSLHRIAGLESVHVIITDQPIASGFGAALRARGIELVVAGVDA